MPIALAALPVAVVAIVAVMFLYAARQLWYPLLQAIAQEIPVVGGYVAGAIEHVISAIAHGVSGWVNHSVGALATLIWAPLNTVATLYEDLQGFAASSANALRRIVTVVIPGQVIGLQQSILVWASIAMAHADQEVNNVIVWTQALVGVAISHTDALGNAIVSWTAGQLAALSITLSTAVSNIVAWTQALVAGAIAHADAVGANVVAWASSQMAALAGTFERGIASEAQRATTAEAATAATAAAAVAVVATDVAQWRQKCGDPLCNNLNGFGNLLKDLGPFVEGGLLLAFALACAADAPGMARLVDGAISGPVTAAVAPIRSAV